MVRCCQGASCSCVLEAGAGIVVLGSGSSQDPFVISTNSGSFSVTDTSVFDLSLTGDGSGASPYNLSVAFDPGATLNDIPDVNAPTPSNGQVLSYDSGTNSWVPAAPTTAPTGAVTTDDSLLGDGSVGDPLEVQEDPDRFLATGASGLGLSNDGINNLIRHYTDSTARAADPIAPALNTISALDVNLGQLDYWDGAAWQPVPDQFSTVVADGELLDLSGPYVAGMTLTHLIKQVSETSDGLGVFDVLDATDLTGYAGVLSAQFQETGTLVWKAVLFGDVTKVSATAYHLTDGTVYPAQLFSGVVDAWLYS